jgi:PAS domain S-box-containing protein
MASREIESDAPLLGPDRLRASVRSLFAGVFLVLTLVLIVALWWEREEALRAAQSRAENLALILADHLDRTVSAIDTTLAQLALHGGRVGGAKAPDEAWDGVLASALAGLVGVGSISIADGDGVITHATIPALVGQSRADQLLTRQLAASGARGLAVDTPFRGRSGQWLIPLGRRLPSPDGKFAGVVVATLDPGRLAEFYRTVDVGREGMIWLMHPAGDVLFRQPAQPGAAGEPARDNPLLGPPPGSSGTLRAALEPGGATYLNAYRSVGNPPLLLAVSLSERETLSAWWLQAAVAFTLVAGFLVLLLSAERAITRAIEARAAADRRNRAQADELATALKLRAEANAALRANQAQFQSIMQHAPMMVSLKDLEGRYTFVNEAFQKFTGRGEDIVLGKTAADLNAKEFADFIAGEDRNAVESRRVIQREIITPPEHGGRTALLVKFPVFDEHGEPVGVGTVMTDITEQKKIEVQLAQTQRIEALGQLTGGIAHDFNNLLTSILLNADVLTSLLDDKLRPLAEAVRMAAERGADLTRRLLAFGRRQMLEPRPTNVKELLTGMGALMRRTLGEHIQIEFRHAADVWFATIDAGQLENAVLNLAVNARDAMPNGGKLTIETANAEFAADEASPEIKPGQYVMIAVGDSGVGMPPDVLARAFEPFFTTKDVGKGTGLGLSMVYGFVKQSGGHARIQSEVGNGTVVRLYMPRAIVDEVAASAATAHATELPKGKETILFVEDDPMVRQYTGQQIVGLGYDVITAENAVQALGLVENGRAPDLLFTDVMMPGGMNGRQLALKLRERWPDLRVLYTSGYAHGRLTIDGESVPSKYVLSKPYRRADLAAKLRDALDDPITSGK